MAIFQDVQSLGYEGTSRMALDLPPTVQRSSSIHAIKQSRLIKSGSVHEHELQVLARRSGPQKMPL